MSKKIGDFKIVQIGCGIVGYAYATAYKNKNCNVIGIEASQTLVEKYRDDIEIYHISESLAHINDVDFIMISINTPLKGEKLDLSYLFSSVRNVAVLVKNSPNAIIVIRSTVPPTTTRKYKEDLKTELKRIGGQSAVNIMFQPEFLRAITAVEDAMNPWYVVCGVDNGMDTAKVLKLYTKFVDEKLIAFCNIEEAEILKVYHNSFNAMKISFTNQADLLCKAIAQQENFSIDAEKIFKIMVNTCEGLMNPKYGTKPGHAYYGTCLPKDSAELASLEKRYGLEIPLFASVVGVNNVVKKSDKEEILNGDHHISFSNLKIKTDIAPVAAKQTLDCESRPIKQTLDCESRPIKQTLDCEPRPIKQTLDCEPGFVKISA